MALERRNISEYHTMWLFAMFDLPVDDKEKRREYALFRKALLKEGFAMLQFSVYARFCGSEERTEVFRKKIQYVLPPDGQVRLMAVTDHQFGKMQVFFGKKKVDTEEPPEQIMLF